MGLLSLFTKKGDKIKDYLANGAVIVDVRSKEEFRGGHIKGAKNMPLPNLSNKLGELKKMGKPVIFCCASGMRSGQATSMMKRQGIDCINGGGWQGLSRYR
jgi:rhodanese-related sulfurtransferase